MRLANTQFCLDSGPGEFSSSGLDVAIQRLCALYLGSESSTSCSTSKPPSPLPHPTPLTPGDNPAPGTLLNLKPCSTTGPCDPTIGNGQRWWTHTRGGDTWLEFAGVARMPPKHTNLCVERSDGRAMIGSCRPGHDNVRFPPQLWTS